MEGFFTKKETESKARPDGKKLTCVVCGLYRKVESPKIPPYGNFKKGIMVVGNSPTTQDDRRGSHWQGSAGRLLKSTLRDLGIDLFEDCINITACHCRTMDKNEEDREPTNFEIECCRKSTLGYITQYAPKVVILMGDSAVFSVIGNQWKKDLGTIHKWRGWCIPDLDLNTWICPTFHPDYIEFIRTKKVQNQGAEETIWKQDLQQAIERASEPLYVYKEPTIEVIEDLSVLNTITSDIAFDYETTGLKPHAEGHRIICCSVATSKDHAYVFMMPKSRKGRQPFVDLLANPQIGKIAQNMKFEESWSEVRLRQPVVNWKWDTMQFTHVMDNRQSITGLKFQAYVQFGVVDYDSEIAPWLKSKKEESCNDINQIETLLMQAGGIKKLLHYCALDSIYEYRLAMRQMSMLDNILPF
jgi:uracil-DNA glycosylase family 4